MQVIGVPTDVSKLDEVIALEAKAREFGGGAIDLLVCSAGIQVSADQIHHAVPITSILMFPMR
jgi:NAD(P)-dependent dehydrogenase (short-subunit alcohol dehydrogenase family)